MAVEQSSGGWTGWVFFAALMMMMVGVFQAIVGFVAIFKDDDFFAANFDKGRLLFEIDYGAWGWIHLLIALVVFFAGLALLRGATWARAVAIILAAVQAATNMVFLPAYPVWSIIIITIDVFVIYAIAVYGGDLRETTARPGTPI